MRSACMMLGLLALGALPALVQVNKWMDEKGQLQYGDRPLAKQSSGTTQLQNAPPKDPRKVAPGSAVTA